MKGKQKLQHKLVPQDIYIFHFHSGVNSKTWLRFLIGLQKMMNEEVVLPNWAEIQEITLELDIFRA